MQSVLFAHRRPPKLRPTIGMTRKKRRSKARFIGRILMAWSVSRAVLFALTFAAMGWGGPAQAQSYPSKSITIVVSIGAGTGMDVLVRLYAEKLQAALSKAVVVENKPGA